MGLPTSVGLGWRPETAWTIDRLGLGFTEVIAERVDPERPAPALLATRARGVPVIPHGVSLGLGGVEPPSAERLARLARVARVLEAPLVSEHLAMVRAGGVEAGHLLPLPRTRAQLSVVVDHVRRAQDALPVPLALENVAAPFAWPDDQLGEADFIAEVLLRTGAPLLLDVANLHANLVNHGGDLDAALDRLPLDRVAYLHVAGGARVARLYRDTHAHPLPPSVLDALAAVLARTGPRPVLLERDAHFDREAIDAELAAIARVIAAAPAPAPAQDRDALAAQQRALVAALVGGAADPPGFTAEGLAEARAILGAKRR